MQDKQTLLEVIKSEMKELGKNAIGNIPFVGPLCSFIVSIYGTYTTVSDQLFLNNCKGVLSRMGRNLGDDIKMSARFRELLENDDAIEQMLLWMNSIDDVRKRDYYGDLFSCAFTHEMHPALLYLLINILKNCTSYELNYLQGYDYSHIKTLDETMSFLCSKGLFQEISSDEYSSDAKENLYKLSGLGKALKANCTNYNGGKLPFTRPLNIEDLGCQNVFASITPGNMKDLLKTLSG